MGMEVELILLAALIIIFIASFCGLLKKIRKTYEHDIELTERVANVSSSQVFTNPILNEDGMDGVFPAAPPPYTETCCEPPPKYEDIIKNESCRVNIPS